MTQPKGAKAGNDMWLAAGINFPPEAITKKFFFGGVSGSGKTYAGGKFAELLLSLGAQTIIIDVIGNWWGLRLDADGKSPGISIPVIGGEHGDIPIEYTGGNIVAEFITESASSAVIDISEFTGAEMRRFVTDFATHMLQLKKRAKSPVMIIWEECQDVVPQKVFGETAKMVGAMEKLIKQGRNYGIGTTLISQRPAAVNKDVLNQCEVLIVFQTPAPQDRKAIEAWIVDRGLEKNPLADLPKLAKGECFIWSPSWLQIFERTHILKKETYDASATPEFGTKETARHLAPIDLNKLSDKMKATMEQVKANDPAVLKKTIAELSQQLATAESLSGKDTQDYIQLKSKFDQSETSRLHYFKVIQNLKESLEKYEIAFGSIENTLDQVKRNATEHDSIEKEFTAITVEHRPEEISKINFKINSVHPIIVGPATAKPNNEVSDGPLNRSKNRILTALAQHGPLTKEQIAITARYSSSSGSFEESLRQLRDMGYIDMPRGDEKASITGEGLAALGSYVPLPKGKELIQWWLNKLSKAEGAILRFLISEHPRAWDSDGIASHTGYSKTSGSFEEALRTIVKLELVKKVDKKYSASETFFK